jgi:hypothetical protein
MTTIAPHKMILLSSARNISRDVPGRYPCMVDQSNLQRQMKPHHSAWLKSEYHVNIYSPNTDSGSVGEEKLHHSR